MFYNPNIFLCSAKSDLCLDAITMNEDIIKKKWIISQWAFAFVYKEKNEKM